MSKRQFLSLVKKAEGDWDFLLFLVNAFFEKKEKK